MFDPERFISAQKDHYAQAITELHSGRKTTHWMWFIFPQLKGLGKSKTANYFGLDDIDAAKAYLEHIELGPRLLHASNVILLKSGNPIASVLG